MNWDRGCGVGGTNTPGEFTYSLVSGYLLCEQERHVSREFALVLMSLVNNVLETDALSKTSDNEIKDLQ